jgi:hypothetical protein
MAKRLNNESPISDVLKAFIENNKLQTGMDKIEVEKAWRELMGNGVNTYTKEVILKGTSLYVTLTSSVLREELNHGRQKIIEMLNQELGKEIIKKLVLI